MKQTNIFGEVISTGVTTSSLGAINNAGPKLASESQLEYLEQLRIRTGIDVGSATTTSHEVSYLIKYLKPLRSAKQLEMLLQLDPEFIENNGEELTMREASELINILIEKQKEERKNSIPEHYLDKLYKTVTYISIPWEDLGVVRSVDHSWISREDFGSALAALDIDDVKDFIKRYKEDIDKYRQPSDDQVNTFVSVSLAESSSHTEESLRFFAMAYSKDELSLIISNKLSEQRQWPTSLPKEAPHNATLIERANKILYSLMSSADMDYRDYEIDSSDRDSTVDLIGAVISTGALTFREVVQRLSESSFLPSYLS
jgi:hypothetical protein